MGKIYKIKYFFVASIIALVCFNLILNAVKAASSEVINNINISADSGNNQASGGEAVEGNVKTEVKNEVIVNDQVLVNEQIKEEIATSTEINLESKVETGGNMANIEILKEINGQVEKAEKNIELNINKNINQDNNSTKQAENNASASEEELFNINQAEEVKQDNEVAEKKVIVKFFNKIITRLKENFLKFIKIFV